MIPIVIGALGYVAKSLVSYVKQLGFKDKHAIFVTRKQQSLATSGTVKICKTFLKFNEKSSLCDVVKIHEIYLET